MNNLSTLTSSLTQADDVFFVPCDRIEVSPFQPREFFEQEKLVQLGQDIRERGLLHPILLRPHPRREGWFQLVGGERRWRGSVLEGLPTIRATVRDWNDLEAAEIALQENLQDESLTDLEEAKGVKNLLIQWEKAGVELNNTQLARKINKSSTFITNCWKILQLPDDFLELAKTRRGVKSSLFAINEVKDSTKREEYLTMVKKGDSFRTISQQIEKDRERAKLLSQSSKAPDTQTQERQNANARGESSSMSRGRRVQTPKGPSRHERLMTVLRLQNEYIASTKDLTNEEWDEHVVPFSRRLLRGDLSR